MPNKCCIVNCNSNYKSVLLKGAEYVSVYRFPKNREQAEDWLRAIPKCSNLKSFDDIKSNTVVCAKHWPSDAPFKNNRPAVYQKSCRSILQSEACIAA